MRKLNILETLLCELDNALRIIAPAEKRPSQRQIPGQALTSATLSPQEKRHVAGLMRVNHSGEICAQALYRGQALTAELSKVKSQMYAAAAEEIDHLSWCEARLRELNSQPSLFDPLWYMGSFMLGALAGLAGDRWSLGFVAETEFQVSAHLQKHLQVLPAQDEKSRAILKQMQIDEAQHAQTARNAGGMELPFVIKKLMEKTSKLMTYTSYYF